MLSEKTFQGAIGIAVLRQVRINDDHNYEAAWKLAKFDYYLGLHATDNREREGAFQEGVDTGRIAVTPAR